MDSGDRVLYTSNKIDRYPRNEARPKTYPEGTYGKVIGGTVAVARNNVSRSINLSNNLPFITLENGSPISNELRPVVMSQLVTLGVPFDRHGERLTAMISDEITSSRKSRWWSSTKGWNQNWDTGPPLDHLNPVS